LTSDRQIYERAIALGHYFRCKSPIHLSLPGLVDYHDSSLGLNLKIHPLAAALARSQFRRLDRRLDAMSENHAHFAAAVAGSAGFRIQQTPPWAQRVSRYGFNVHWRSQGADMPSLKAVVAAIKAEGVKVSTAGSPPLFRLPLFRRPEDSGLPGTVAGPRDDSAFPGASRHVASLLRFPSLFSSNPIWVERYARALDKVDRNLGALASWEKCQT
jgi:dTDP-4-amino-4,6-dideoxygalactose transaminase